MGAAHRREDRSRPAEAARARPWPPQPASATGVVRRTRHQRRTSAPPGPRRRLPQASRRRRPVSRDEAHRVLATGLPGCSHCQPDVQLNILDLFARTPCIRRRGARTEHLPPGASTHRDT
ncbi:DUF6233 domain-containing protein [Streptomyces sp. RG80]|uniref:DUF6233 domain-containing protein n=1 Tax=Streptomyces sp. RG80 TaxID=3157340 RepID=UPI00338FC57B